MAFIFIIMVHEIVLSTQLTVNNSRVFQNRPIQCSGNMPSARIKQSTRQMLSWPHNEAFSQVESVEKITAMMTKSGTFLIRDMLIMALG